MPRYSQSSEFPLLADCEQTTLYRKMCFALLLVIVADSVRAWT